MPDEVDHPVFQTSKVRRKEIVQDCIDALFDFGKHHPEQMKDGWPINWRRYVHGTRKLGRDIARTNLQQFDVFAKANHGSKDLMEWISRQNTLAEWG